MRAKTATRRFDRDDEHDTRGALYGATRSALLLCCCASHAMRRIIDEHAAADRRAHRLSAAGVRRALRNARL